jgi:arylsulfatase A-like enzyme
LILIMADDLGHADLGCYGQQKIKTPSLDRMAREGMRFTDAYAGSAVCAPSRSCLLTGQHTGHTPVRGNPAFAVGWDRKAHGDTALPEGTFTVSKAAKEAGYVTACIGKWGMGNPGTTGDPLKQGFDYHYGYLDHEHAHNYYPQHLFRNNEKVPRKDKEYSHDLIAEDALRWVREQAGKPFFLYFTPTIPHSKLNPPDVEPYADTGWDEPDKAYAAMVTRMDKDIGRLLDLLAELKIDQNTLVLFTSDNGTHNAGRKAAFLKSSGPLRGAKRDVYEGGIRVPLLARWPGTIPAGQVSGQITANWDFLPTFTDLAGRPAPAGIDGVSILPTLKAQPDLQKKHDYLYWEFVEQGGKQAVRQGRYKAVRLGVSKNAEAPIELFDLEKDPGETTNIAEQSPEMVKSMREIMDKAHTPSKMFPLLPAEGPKIPAKG